MIKKVVCVKEYCDESKQAMRAYGIEPPVLDKIYHVAEVVTMPDGITGYLLEEYQTGGMFEHWFETVMFRDLQDIELDLECEIIEALKAPTPIKQVDFPAPKHYNCKCI